MNEKIQFLTNPTNQINYIILVPKKENTAIEFNFRKLDKNEKLPNEYLKNNEFSKALDGYLTIKKKDSLSKIIKESQLNSLGYKKLRNNNFKDAISIFRINVALYPESSNVYDSLGEAYMKKGDTILALKNYKKSIKLDSGNANAKRQIKKLTSL